MVILGLFNPRAGQGDPQFGLRPGGLGRLVVETFRLFRLAHGDQQIANDLIRFKVVVAILVVIYEFEHKPSCLFERFCARQGSLGHRVGKVKLDVLRDGGRDIAQLG